MSREMNSASVLLLYKLLVTLRPMQHPEQPTRRERAFWIGSMFALGAFGAYAHEPICVLGASLGLFFWLVAHSPRQEGSPS